MFSAFILVAVGGLITFLLPCVTPFGALAACALLRGFNTKTTVIVVATAWTINEAAGFALFHYPQTGDSYVWATLSLVAAVVATMFASWTARALSSRSVGLRSVAVLSIATVIFEAALAGGAIATGRSMGGFSVDIDFLVVETNVAFFAAFETMALLRRTIVARFGARHA